MDCRATKNAACAIRLRYLYIHFPMYRSFADSTPKQNTKSCVNVFSEGSPSRSRIVLRISFGMTALPKSSILRTKPVAFILCLLIIDYTVLG